MRDRLDRRVVLITGGASGIGSAAARQMAELGDEVVMADLSAVGESVARSIGCQYARLDVTDGVEWSRVVRGIDEKYGRIDVLVKCAGIEGDQTNNSVLSTSLAEWRRVHAVNLDGTFLGCQSVIPVMTRQRSGSIINLSSVVAYFPGPFNCAYGSSKAVQHLSKSVAAWGTREGNRIRCNSVHPGLVGTRMLFSVVGQRAGRPDDGAEVAKNLAAKTVPLGEVITPEEIGKIIVYLASEDARHVTGCEFVVDAGWQLTHGMMPTIH